MNKLVLEFETYFDKEYNLKKLCTEEYIASTQFKVQLIGWKENNQKANSSADIDNTLKYLQSIHGNNFENAVVIAHNSMFDIYILSKIYRIKPPNIIDTLLLAGHIYGKNRNENLIDLSLGSLAKHHGLKLKGDLTFMKGNDSPSTEQLIELQSYCENDVELTAQLFEILIKKITNPITELRIINHTIQIFINRKIRVDGEKIQQLIIDESLKLENQLKDLNTTKEEINGVKSFQNLLQPALKLTGETLPMKKGKKGLIPATSKNDSEMLDLCNHKDAQVRKLAQVRLASKSCDTSISKAKKLQKLAALNGGYIYPNLKYYGAGVTGRFSSTGFNLQNQGKNEVGMEIRNSLLAEVGKQFVIADLNAIEARVLAWFANETNLLDTFKLNRDPYSEFASNIFNCKVYKPKDGDPDKDNLQKMRNTGKTAILGLGYGMGPIKFFDSLNENANTKDLVVAGLINTKKSKEIVNSYRSNMSNIARLWEKSEAAFKNTINNKDFSECQTLTFLYKNDNVHIRLPSSRELYYPKPTLVRETKSGETFDDKGNLKKWENNSLSIKYGNSIDLYGGKIVENIVQAIARDILVEIILKLEERNIPVLFHVHDEVICEVDESIAKETAKIVKEIMITPPSWAQGLPLDAEVKISKCYSK
jgi:DNA polymerase